MKTWARWSWCHILKSCSMVFQGYYPLHRRAFVFHVDQTCLQENQPMSRLQISKIVNNYCLNLLNILLSHTCDNLKINRTLNANNRKLVRGAIGCDVLNWKKNYFYKIWCDFGGKNPHNIPSRNERVGWLQHVDESRHIGSACEEF